MFKKLWKKVNDYWENTKPVVLNFVFPKIDGLVPVVSSYIIERKKELMKLLAQSDEVIKEFVQTQANALKDYIRRQL